jgi:hypothetical protein
MYASTTLILISNKRNRHEPQHQSIPCYIELLYQLSWRSINSSPCRAWLQSFSCLLNSPVPDPQLTPVSRPPSNPTEPTYRPTLHVPYGCPTLTLHSCVLSLSATLAFLHTCTCLACPPIIPIVYRGQQRNTPRGRKTSNHLLSH